MEFTTLGRTGLSVSVAGLGCGGHSRLGQAYGNSSAESVAVVAAALDVGVNFIDTAAAYRTEPIVGQALQGRRDGVIVSSKTAVEREPFNRKAQDELMSAAQLTERLDASLQRLQTDYIDIYNLHGVLASQLDHVEAELVPELLRLKQQGKIRWLGITERFVVDTSHTMLQRAVPSGVWDVVMVGFNLLNPSARHCVLNKTQELDVGIQDMFAVRRALRDPEALREEIRKAAAAGQLDTAALDPVDPLRDILSTSDASCLIELAYRFCRHEPGVHVVLTGTGRINHLIDNVAYINGPPLPEHTQAALAEIFGRVDCLSGN